MKKYIPFVVSIAFYLCSCSGDEEESKPVTDASEHEITTTTSMRFSPELLNAKVGDVIKFNIGAGYTVTRVSEVSWNSGDPLSNGGFDFPFGTHTYTLQAADVGTVYYVCKFHVGDGMKGKILVSVK